MAGVLQADAVRAQRRGWQAGASRAIQLAALHLQAAARAAARRTLPPSWRAICWGCFSLISLCSRIVPSTSHYRLSTVAVPLPASFSTLIMWH